MFQIQGKIPRSIVLGCSGGVDSMAVLNFLSRNHKVIVHFVHHNTETSKKAFYFLNSYYHDTNKNFDFVTTTITNSKPASESWEEFWRNERYKAFKKWGDVKVVTCHHLDDCVEQWLFSSLHGNPNVIPYKHSNVIRPFRLNRKKKFIEWCTAHSVPWVEDTSNQDSKYIRNYIRNKMMDHVLHVNPGIHITIRNKMLFDNSIN